MRQRADPETAERSSQVLEATSLQDFHARAIAQGLTSARSRFLTVVLDISNTCNLRCRMCYFSLDTHRKRPTVFVTPAQFRVLCDEVLPVTQTLSLSCGNEPLISPHIVALLGHVRDSGVPTVDLTTNGSRLTTELIDALVSSGVSEISVSVDAARRETYERIRVGASFDRLVAGLEALRRRKQECRSRLPVVRFNVTLMRAALEELEELVVLAHGLGVERLDFRHMLVWEGLDTDAESLRHVPSVANERLERALLKAQALGLEVVACPGYFADESGMVRRAWAPATGTRIRRALSAPGRLLRRAVDGGLTDGARWLRRRLECAGTGVRRADPYCALPFSYALVNAGGGVYPCPYCHGVDPYGHLWRGETFETIWLGPAFRALRARILADDPPDMCRACPTQGGRFGDERVFEARVV